MRTILPTIRIFGLDISMYIVFMVLGIVAVCVFNVFRRKRLNLKPWGLVLLFALCLTFLFVFCRIFYVFARMLEGAVTLKAIWRALTLGGFVMYGGIFGIILGCVVFALITKRPVRAVLDYFAPSIALAFTFARFGCLFEGCCYGIEWSWGVPNVKFPGKLLFPAQPLDALASLLLFAAILIRTKVKKTDRYSLEIYLTGYAIARFLLEFVRVKTSPGFLPFGFTFSQDISIVIVVLVIAETIIVLLGTPTRSPEK